MESKRINIPLYPGGLVVFLGDLKEVEGKYDLRSTFGCNALCFPREQEEKFTVHLCFSSLPSMGTLAHECFHATSFILGRLGVHPDHDNDEAQAYLLDWVVDTVYGELRKLEKYVD